MAVARFTQETTVLFWMTAFLGVSLICTVVMMVVLLVKGDERKKMILSKAALFALIAGIVILVSGFVYQSFIQPHINFTMELNPVMFLGAIAIVFDIAYFYYRRKYGA